MRRRRMYLTNQSIPQQQDIKSHLANILSFHTSTAGNFTYRYNYYIEELPTLRKLSKGVILLGRKESTTIEKLREYFGITVEEDLDSNKYILQNIPDRLQKFLDKYGAVPTHGSIEENRVGQKDNIGYGDIIRKGRLQYTLRIKGYIPATHTMIEVFIDEWGGCGIYRVGSDIAAICAYMGITLEQIQSIYDSRETTTIEHRVAVLMGLLEGRTLWKE
jgi:chemotaxis signal transduction protein